MATDKKYFFRCLLLLWCILFTLGAHAQEPLGDELEPDTCAACREVNGTLHCPTFVALRSNLLFDAVLVPNIGVEFTLCQQLSVVLDYYGTWLKTDRHHRYWQCYGGYVSLRHYLRDWLNPVNDMTGHHVGAYLCLMTYDVEWGGRGYQCATPGIGFGLEYGYTMKLGRRLQLDFNLGLGYFYNEYDEYLPTFDGTNHYVWQSTHQRNWWGPTKAEVCLKWVIGKGGGR